MHSKRHHSKRRTKPKLFPFLASLLFVSACGTTLDDKIPLENVANTSDQTSATPPSIKTVVQAPKSQRPPNSAAMQTAKPLGIIKGKLVPLKDDFYPADQFSQAIKYAENMESYALLVWHKGALRMEHYYDSFDKSLKSETASMHKSVLGLLVAAAIEDGYITNADARIGDYISAWEDLPEGDITIRQLLTMSSGLKGLNRDGGFNSELMKFYSGQLNARETLLAMRLEATPGVAPPVVAPPGTNFTYANTNSQLLALILEAATKMPYAQYLSQRLWQPLGADDAAVWYFEETGFPRAFSSLLARARDWIKVGLLIKNKGEYQGKQIISSDSIEAITTSSATNPNYGWQIWLGRNAQTKRYYNDTKTGFSIPASEPFAVDDMVYFDGFGGQRVYISEAADLVIVRIGESRLDWDDSQLPNMIIDLLQN